MNLSRGKSLNLSVRDRLPRLCLEAKGSPFESLNNTKSLRWESNQRPLGSLAKVAESCRALETLELRRPRRCALCDQTRNKNYAEGPLGQLDLPRLHKLVFD